MRGTALSLPSPFVYIGPDVDRARFGEWGVLLGNRRARWIDVFALEASRSQRVQDVVEERFGHHAPWDAVGISIPSREAMRRSASLLEDLVPGDLLFTEKRLAFHAGLGWAQPRLSP